ncbi:MAG: cation transporting ATPase C-terminal domain-containing protein [Candidatus Micrarchaeota archaeon]
MLTVYAVRWRHGEGITRIASNKWLHLAVLSSIILEFAVISPPLNSYFGTVPIGIGEIEEIAAGLLGYVILLSIALKLEPIIIGPRKRPASVFSSRRPTL